MDIQTFIQNFADQFDETDINEINATTVFKNLDEWSSLTAMGLIAMVRTAYGKSLTGEEIRQANTIEDLFNIVKNK